MLHPDNIWQLPYKKLGWLTSLGSISFNVLSLKATHIKTLLDPQCPLSAPNLVQKHWGCSILPSTVFPFCTQTCPKHWGCSFLPSPVLRFWSQNSANTGVPFWAQSNGSETRPTGRIVQIQDPPLSNDNICPPASQLLRQSSTQAIRRFCQFRWLFLHQAQLILVFPSKRLNLLHP